MWRIVEAVLPQGRQAAFDSRFVVDEDVAAHPGFVFGDNHAPCPFRAQVLFHPGDFLAGAVAVLVYRRGADTHVVAGSQKGVGSFHCAGHWRQAFEKTDCAVEFGRVRAQVLGQAVADIENVFFAFYRRVFAEAAAPMAAESAFKVGEHVVLVEQDEHGGLSVVCWDKAG